MLKELIAERISVYRISKKLSEEIKRTMNHYLNGQIRNQEVIDELLKTIQDMVFASAEKKDLGLTEEKFAFYEVLKS